jgi:hypothetical protein
MDAQNPVWTGPEPQPFAGKAWHKKVTATRVKYILWLPLHLLLAFVNTQCQLGCCSFVRFRTNWVKKTGQWVWDFGCQHGNFRHKRHLPQSDQADESGAMNCCMHGTPAALALMLRDISSSGPSTVDSWNKALIAVEHTGDDEGASTAVLKVDCQCHFSVTCYKEKPEVQITYHQAGHVDINGRICHGPAAKKATYHKGRLSDEFRDFVRALALRGVPFAKILEGKLQCLFSESCRADAAPLQAAWYQHMARHMLLEGWTMSQIDVMVLGHNHLPRDWKVSVKDIRNVVGRDAQAVVRLDPDDALSVEQHAKNADNTYVYRRQIVEDNEQKQTFVWGFNTPCTLAALLEFGHEQPVVIDSTFGTNQYMVRISFGRTIVTELLVADMHMGSPPSQFSLFTVMVNDPHGHGE